MKKSILTLVGILVLVFLLTGAAYVGGKLYQAQQQARVENGHQPRKLVTPAPEMPRTPPVGGGEFQSRDGNSIMVCQPQNRNQPTFDKKRVVQEAETCSAQFEVVLTHDTVLLRDITGRTYVTPLPNGDLVIQEVVEPGSDAEIGDGTVMKVWGTLTGNRIVARTILYSNYTPRPTPVPESK